MQAGRKNSSTVLPASLLLSPSVPWRLPECEVSSNKLAAL